MKTIKKLPKEKNPLLRLLKILFKENKFKLLVLFFITFINAIGAIAISLFFQRVIDDVIMPGVINGYSSVQNKFISLLIFMGSTYIILTLASLLNAQLIAGLSNNFEYRLRKKIFDHMELLPISYFDKSKRGKIMSVYTNDIETLREVVNNVIPEVFTAAISLTGIVVVMLYYSIYFTFLALLSLVFIFVFTRGITKKIKKDFIAYQEMIASKDAFVEEMMQGQKIIKLFNYEESALKNFNEYNDKLYHTSKRANYLGNLVVPILHNIGNVLYVIIAITSLAFFSFGLKNLSIAGLDTLSVGTLIAFLALSRRYSNNFNQLAQQINTMVLGIAGAKRICTILDEPKETDDGKVELVNVVSENELVATSTNTGVFAWKYEENNEIKYKPLLGDISFNNVSFGYKENKLILKNITLNVKKGQKIALVGKTGAGKTTIANLLTRFYDVNEGDIEYDGFNIKEIKKSSLRKAVGIVLQDITIFNDSVKDNILYGHLDRSLDEVKNAAKLANAHDFIKRLPYSYDTILENNGENLSQGQRQLISIARTILVNPPVLILDEATSSIDTRTELIVQRGLDNLIKNRTVFVIAHRLSTIRNADLIIVLDNGKIEEMGNHKELIAKKGTYHKLYTGQVELE